MKSARFLLAGSLLSCAIIATACGRETLDPVDGSSNGGPSAPGTGTSPPESPPVSNEFDKAALLGAIADCVVSVYETANTSAATLAGAVDAWAAAPADAAAKTAAREAFATTMQAWQQAEMFQFGPLGMNNSPGGRELRDPIYAWPLFARCTVDQNLESKRYAAATFIDASFANVRGLGTLEYLLFEDGTGNGCPADNALNAEGKWTAIAAELPARKAEYAKVVAGDVSRRIAQLVTYWTPAGDDFATKLKTAGSGSTVYPSDQTAFNAVNQGLFYLEREVKDMKLAWPANLSGHCATPTCPEALESQFANRSADYLEANLRAFRKLFVSCDGSDQGLGFAAYLRARNAGELADRMRRELDGAIEHVQAIQDRSLRTQTSDGSIRTVYDEIKNVTDDLKTEFVSVLDLELPSAVQGDND